MYSPAISDISYNKTFAGLNSCELACVLSVFYDIRLQEENRVFT